METIKRGVVHVEASEKAFKRIAKEMLKEHFIAKRIKVEANWLDEGICVTACGVNIYAEACEAEIIYTGDKKVNLHQSKNKVEAKYFIRVD